MMPSKPAGPIRRAWLTWRKLKLPWRKKFFIGLDLSGNTFWEFKDTLNAGSHRMRRIVEYPRSTHYSEVKISPQWHQWLRHTRNSPPTITEQSQDLLRQERLKVLAAEADARWAAKPSFLDQPSEQQPLPAFGVKDPGGYAQPTEDPEKEGVRNAIGGGLEDEVQGTNTKMKDLLEEDIQSSDNENPGEAHREEPTKSEAKVYKEDPWKKARGGPSEEWTPQAWDPNANKGR